MWEIRWRDNCTWLYIVVADKIDVDVDVDMMELDDPKHNRNEYFPWEPRYQLTEPQTKVKPKKLLCHVKTETNEANPWIQQM